DVRQARRLLPPIGLGQLVAMVVGGVLMPPLIGLIGTENLLVTAAVGLAGSLFVLRLLVRDYGHQLEVVPTKPAPRRIHVGVQRLLGDRYVLLLFAFMILYESAY